MGQLVNLLTLTLDFSGQKIFILAEGQLTHFAIVVKSRCKVNNPDFILTLTMFRLPLPVISFIVKFLN